MIEEIEFKGEWYIPDISKIKLSGTLKIKQNKQVVLELICPRHLFQNFFNYSRIPFPIKIDIICGTSKSKYISLVNCGSLLPITFKDPIVIEFTVDIVFVGKLFTNYNQLLFNNIIIDIAYLDKWANIQNIYIKDSSNNYIRLTYRKPKDFLVFVGKGFKISIYFDFYHNITKLGEVSLSSKPYLKILAKKERHFDDFINMLYLFQRFLVLAILEPVHPLSIKGITKENESIDIYYAINDDSPELIKESPYILFTLDKISKQLRECFKIFVNKNDLLETIYDIYFATIYTTKKYLGNWFLSLIFAIEAFHRRIVGGVYQDKETYLEVVYKQLIEAIPNNIEKDFKNSLINRIKYCYQYSLRKRLNWFLQNLPINIMNELLDNYSKDQFIDNVLEIRNKLVHYEKGTNNKIDVRKTYHLIKKLRMLLHLLLLNEIGVKIEEIDWRKLLR